IGHFVDQARRSGASWTDIGHSMGVTKQAAQKRFVPKETTLEQAMQTYSRYTDKARHVIVESQEAAKRAGNTYIGVAHLVLGLLIEPTALAARTMVDLGAPLDTVREAMVNLLEPAVANSPDRPPFSVKAKKVLELTLREALRLGHNYVGTEHLLLGVLKLEEESTAKTVLEGLGVTHEQAEAAILRFLEEHLRGKQG
ncbi:MAG: ATP-dependent Clp protease ATP-binding subunit, partial [Nonomuraea sp.]|nr:ATP-dependent Clp protease ATP-binding subunit [Nonomuraea sp.]